MADSTATPTPARRAVLLNLLAATEGGQVTRARHFLGLLRRYDPATPFLVLKARGTLPFCQSGGGIDVREVKIGSVGLTRAGRRMLWENRALPRLVRAPERYVYLTFSHYLPPTFPRSAISVVGVSNLAPFSREALAAEPRVLGRIKLRALRASIISSSRRATAVIALSHACKATLAAHGIDSGKIHVVPNGVLPPTLDRDHGGSLLQALGLQAGYLLCVSHFHRYKNFSRLVDAYRLLDPRFRAAVPLVIVGKPLDPGCFADIERQVRAAGLQQSVRIVPGLEHEQLHSLYAHASLFVFPSLVENSPNILLEAMASGLPVLASRIAPMPEFGGDAAVYFDPQSASDMARTIAAVAADEPLCAAMRVRSREQAARFSWEKFTARVVEIYQGVGLASPYR